MEKKLTSQGPKGRQSFTVTLPKEWVLKENLDKSKEIELEIIGNKIVISKEKRLDKPIEINIDDYKDSIAKTLQGLYRVGIDELIINYNSENLLENITDIINKKLIGYEIVEQRKNMIIIKYIVKESEEDFKIVLRRIFLLLLELQETEGKIKIRTLENNISRLFNYCQRILIKKGHLDYLKIPFYYLLLDSIDKICDELVWLSDIKEFTKKQKDYKKKLITYLNTAYNLFYKFDKSTFNELVDSTYRLKNELKFSLNIDRADMHLHNLSRLINSLTGTIYCINFKGE